MVFSFGFDLLFVIFCSDLKDTIFTDLTILFTHIYTGATVSKGETWAFEQTDPSGLLVDPVCPLDLGGMML